MTAKHILQKYLERLDDKITVLTVKHDEAQTRLEISISEDKEKDEIIRETSQIEIDILTFEKNYLITQIIEGLE